MTDKKENPHNKNDHANSSDIQAHLNALLSGKVESSKPKRSKQSDKKEPQPNPKQADDRQGTKDNHDTDTSDEAIKSDESLKSGVNVYEGKVTNKGLADSLDLPYTELDL